MKTLSVLLSIAFASQSALAAQETCQAKIDSLAKQGVAVSLLQELADKAQTMNVRAGSTVVLVDLRPHISVLRLDVVDLATATAVRLHVTHGKGSDVDGDGFATDFVRGTRKQMTELGLYQIPQAPIEHSYKIIGLEETNSTAQKRGVSFENCPPADTVPMTASFGSFCISKPAFTEIESRVAGSLLLAGLASPEVAATPALCRLLGSGD